MAAQDTLSVRALSRGRHPRDTRGLLSTWETSPTSYGPWTSLMAWTIKNLPAVPESGVPSLGQEDPWGREWQPTPVFLPGEFHGQRSLVGYSPRGHK